MKKFAKWSALAAGLVVIALSATGCASAKYATDDLVYDDVVKGGGDYIEVRFLDVSDKQWTQKVSVVSIDGHTIPAKFPGSENIAIPTRGPLNLKVHLRVQKKATQVNSNDVLGSLFNAAKSAVVDAAKGRKEINTDFDLVIPELPPKTKVDIEYFEVDAVGEWGAADVKKLAGGEGDALANQFLLISIPAGKDDIPPAPGAVKIRRNLAGYSIWGLKAIRL